MNKIIENKQLIIKDVVGIEYMDALTSGAVITCNHFNAFDSFAMQIAYEKSRQCKKRRLYRVIREGNYTNFPGFYGMLMRNCYTFPLSSNRDTMKKFLSSMDTVLQHGYFMLVYPEPVSYTHLDVYKRQVFQSGLTQFSNVKLRSFQSKKGRVNAYIAQNR